MENNYICCFTGHRSICDDHMIELPNTLAQIIKEQYDRGVRVFRSGGAVGFDSIAALKVIAMRQKYPDIKLELCLPCRDQADKWNEYNKSIYKFILESSDKISYVCDSYVSGCMHARNRKLVDGAHVCIAYYTGGSGGTAYTVSLAEKLDRKVINLAEI